MKTDGMKRNQDQRRSRLWFAVSVCFFLVAASLAGMAGRIWLSYRSSEQGLQELYMAMDQAVGTEMAEGVGEDGGGADGQAAGGWASGAAGPEAQLDERPAPAESPVPAGGRRDSYGALMAQNPDMVGWIQIPGTVVDYPVMHTPEDPDYYFHRDFYGSQSAYGMIYMDASCEPGISRNLLLYGHHMRNGAMFASIEKYASPAYRQEHPVVHFDMPDQKGDYQVLAAMRISADGLDEAFLKMLAAGTEEDYRNLTDYLRSYALYQTGVEALWPQQLVTLTTCEYSRKNGRFLVIAVRTEE